MEEFTGDFEALHICLLLFLGLQLLDFVSCSSSGLGVKRLISNLAPSPSFFDSIALLNCFYKGLTSMNR